MALALTAAGTAACEPLPPRLQLTVDSPLFLGDADPGDGICATDLGGCTLRAAIEEGDLAPDGADITVTVASADSIDRTFTGSVSISAAPGTRVTITGATYTVAAGGHLALAGINTSRNIAGTDLLRLEVSGSALVNRSVLSHLSVAPGGWAALGDSAVFDYATPTVVNQGVLALVRSSLLAHDLDGSATDTVLHTAPGATTHVTASVIAQPRVLSDAGHDFAGGGGTCTGERPIPLALAYAEAPGPCVALPFAQPAGVTYTATLGRNGQIGFELGLEDDSRLIDAVGLSSAACDTAAVDLYGNPRGVDGDGSGTGGCDIGAVERQP